MDTWHCGPVLAMEEPPLLMAVAGVPGVKGVTSKLETHAAADGVSMLQGDDRTERQRAGMLPLRWTPTTRAVLGAGLVASGVLITRVARRGSTSSEFTHGEM